MKDARSVFAGIRARLPGGNVFNAVKESYKLYRADKCCQLYKEQLIINLCGLFHVNTGEVRRKKIKVLKRIVFDEDKLLYHVTDRSNMESIMEQGIIDQNHFAVYLTDSEEYAKELQTWKHNPVKLTVDAGTMVKDGYTFFQNCRRKYIYTTCSVAPKYIQIFDTPV